VFTTYVFAIPKIFITKFEKHKENKYKLVCRTEKGLNHLLLLLLLEPLARQSLVVDLEVVLKPSQIFLYEVHNIESSEQANTSRVSNKPKSNKQLDKLEGVTI
jgi:hypothetical protein